MKSKLLIEKRINKIVKEAIKTLKEDYNIEDEEAKADEIIANTPIQGEWVACRLVQGGRLGYIGKICLGKYRQRLNVDELEIIFDLCNYGPANMDSLSVNYRTAKHTIGYMRDGAVLLPLSQINLCNDDLFVYNVTDPTHGYFLSSNGRTKSEEWKGGTIDDFYDEMKKNKFYYNMETKSFR